MREKRTSFCASMLDNIKKKCSYLRPLLSITFPLGFRISKNIGHPTLGSGGKKTVKRYLKREKSEEEKNFVRRFQTIFKQKCSYLRPLLSITFPQGFRISKNIGHTTSGIGGTKTVKKTKNRRRPKKVKKKTFFCAAILDHFKQKCSYLRPLLSITFPQGFRISKNIGHPTSRSGGTKTVKKTKNRRRPKKVKKKTFFCAAILDNFQTNMFISETTSFHFFPPRIPKL